MHNPGIKELRGLITLGNQKHDSAFQLQGNFISQFVAI